MLGLKWFIAPFMGETSTGSTDAVKRPGGITDGPLTSGKNRMTYGSVVDNKLNHVEIPVVCWYILIVELCERLAFYTITGSQAFFLEHLGYQLSAAGALNATMWTLCTALAVFASWVADVCLGRYYTILVSACLYATGCTIASLSAWPNTERPGWYFLGVMFLLPIATAGIKSNISNFGADQYDESDPSQKAAQEKFFTIFYSSINVGAMLAYGFFTTFATSGGFGVPKAWGYAASYGIVALFMIVAALVYQAGRSKYKVHPMLKRSALATLMECLAHAATSGGSKQAMYVLTGLFLLAASISLSAAKALLTHAGDSIMAAAFICALVGTICVVVPCFETSWVRSGGAVTEDQFREQQDVQDFLAILPPLFTANIGFNALYNCMQFWYAQQACQMDVRVSLVQNFQLSGSFFNIADCIAVVMVTPLAIAYIDPWLTRVFSGSFDHKKRFSLGMLIACISVLASARIEVLRKQAPVLPEISNCAPPGIGMSDITGAWMTLPFFLMGVAEIYTQPTLLHYAYSQSPPSMRTLAMATTFFIAAVSTSLFALLVNALSAYIPNDLNTGNLEYGYYISTAVGVVFAVLFMGVITQRRLEMPTN